ncbi:MAG: UDP-N-acetylmuramoyl-tripeptide--D-alanyl-D-alanine ligase [Gammaproteobacteria bacterium]|nr:UDP-N-acetylmuramoyl-tripeptide--D-alanyl-D-alanine ligase [Gammaproteobacteria bacterium]
MQLSTAASTVDGQLIGADSWFTAVSTDSRRLRGGELFVALRGPRFDGHDYLAAARAAGAAGALVSDPEGLPFPQVAVTDTLDALTRLAAGWRARYAHPLVAITGSNGKTTVKELIAAICGQLAPTLRTPGNLNNHIGVPLTLLRLRDEHRFAVVEMGMNHAGEITRLSRLAQPAVAVLNNAQAAHLAGFADGVEAVARAKAEIFDGLGNAGMAVVNADDPHASLWLEMLGERQSLRFGEQPDAQVRATDIQGNRFTLLLPDGSATPVRLRLEGRHNVHNALAAAAAAFALGIRPDAIRRGLESVAAIAGRLQRLSLPGGATLLDDSYNANPASLEAAVAVLAAEAGRRVLVLGDMGELGASERQLHARCGTAARTAGLDALYTLGELARSAAEAFGEGAREFDDLPALVAAIQDFLAGPGPVSLLVKGSRASCMERVVKALVGGRVD